MNRIIVVYNTIFGQLNPCIISCTIKNKTARAIPIQRLFGFINKYDTNLCFVLKTIIPKDNIAIIIGI